MKLDTFTGATAIEPTSGTLICKVQRFSSAVVRSADQQDNIYKGSVASTNENYRLKFYDYH